MDRPTFFRSKTSVKTAVLGLSLIALGYLQVAVVLMVLAAGTTTAMFALKTWALWEIAAGYAAILVAAAISAWQATLTGKMFDVILPGFGGIVALLFMVGALIGASDGAFSLGPSAGLFDAGNFVLVAVLLAVTVLMLTNRGTKESVRPAAGLWGGATVGTLVFAIGVAVYDASTSSDGGSIAGSLIEAIGLIVVVIAIRLATLNGVLSRSATTTTVITGLTLFAVATVGLGVSLRINVTTEAALTTQLVISSVFAVTYAVAIALIAHSARLRLSTAESAGNRTVIAPS